MCVGILCEGGGGVCLVCSLLICSLGWGGGPLAGRVAGRRSTQAICIHEDEETDIRSSI